MKTRIALYRNSALFACILGIFLGFPFETTCQRLIGAIAPALAFQAAGADATVGQTAEGLPPQTEDVAPDASDASGPPNEPLTETILPEASDAERVAELQQSIEHDQKQLDELDQEIDNPQSEYALAEEEFRQLNADLESSKEQLEQAKKNENAAIIHKLEQDIASLERQRKLAEERFDLAIEDRKTLRDQRATLRSKLENDKAALANLTGENKDGEQSDRDADRDEQHDDKRDATHLHDRSAKEHPSHAGSPDERGSHRDTRDQETDSDKNDSSSDESAESEETDEEVKQAAAEAREKEEEAEEAQQETQSIAARLSDIQKLVSQEQKELTLAKRKVDLATAAQITLSQELARREAEKADPADINDLRLSIGKASQRLIQARSDVAEISERLNDHRAELGSLQSEHIVALHEAERKRHEAAEADDRVESLRNPFTFRNMLQWTIEHAPRLLLIVVGMFLVNRLASFFAVRSVRLVTSSAGRGSTMERENRAKTLVGVFQNAATVAIFIGGTLMMLEEVGANITVLMGGVAVIGLAVAFGAQNLIKDYFYGFVMLLENQYMLNDTVRIGGVAGQVERITLRMTVLRDSNGIVHFIPNGTINSVSNETHGWSRAVCDIAVGYREDIDHVLQILRSVSDEIMSEPKLSAFIIDKPAEPSIDNVSDTAIHFKVTAKTLPNKHGMVKQEWLRRIKNRFDALGIEPPMQHRIVQVLSSGAADEDTSTNSIIRTPSVRRAS